MDPGIVVVIVFASLILPAMLFLAGSDSDRAKEKERRMAEHRMNARLLRMNI